MAKRGPERSVSDERILFEFLLSPDPALFTSELEEEIDLSRQRINDILDDLEARGLVTSKKKSGRRLWWLTDDGRKHIAAAAREQFD